MVTTKYKPFKLKKKGKRKRKRKAKANILTHKRRIIKKPTFSLQRPNGIKK